MTAAADTLERIAAENYSDPATDDLTVPLAIKLAEAEAEIGRLRRDMAGSFTHDQYHAGCDAIRNERNRAQDESERLRERCEAYKGQVAAGAHEIEKLRALLRRYRNETPLGHQPHMIAHEVDAALADT